MSTISFGFNTPQDRIDTIITFAEVIFHSLTEQGYVITKENKGNNIIPRLTKASEVSDDTLLFHDVLHDDVLLRFLLSQTVWIFNEALENSVKEKN